MSELTDLRVFPTFLRSAFRDVTVSRWLAALSFSAFNVFLCRLSAVRSEFSRRSTVHRTFCAAATLAAGGVSADFRVTLLLGFGPFMVVRRRDRDDVVEAVADRDVLRRAAFVLVAALLRPPAALVGVVPGPSLRCDAGTSSPNLWAAILDDSRSLRRGQTGFVGTRGNHQRQEQAPDRRQRRRL